MTVVHTAVASIAPQTGELLAVSVDTLVAGVHFPHATAPADVAWKSLAVNLSDLAAMGAEPLSAQVLCESPATGTRWADDVAAAIQDRAGSPWPLDVAARCAQGPARRVTVQVVGQVPASLTLTRGGAKCGDRIWVSGTTGDAGGGLAVVERRLDAGADAACLRERLDRPQPRVALGIALRGIASAAIDVSDGIAGDAGHIARRSGVGLRIHSERLSVSAALRRAAGTAEARRFAAFAGDDYELLFTAPPQRDTAVRAAANTTATAVTCIGEVVDGHDAWILGPDGARVTGSAFEHFGTASPPR